MATCPPKKSCNGLTAAGGCFFAGTIAMPCVNIFTEQLLAETPPVCLIMWLMAGVA